MTFADDMGFPPLYLVLEVFGPILAVCVALGFVTWLGLERKKKASKKLSRKQKRELEK